MPHLTGVVGFFAHRTVENLEHHGWFLPRKAASRVFAGRNPYRDRRNRGLGYSSGLGDWSGEAVGGKCGMPIESSPVAQCVNASRERQ